jgi:hypothetical protein
MEERFGFIESSPFFSMFALDSLEDDIIRKFGMRGLFVQPIEEFKY